MPASLKPEKFSILYADGATEDALCFHSDIVATENKFDVSIGEEGVTPRMEWTLFMVWSALRRNKRAPDFQEWLDRGVIVEPVEGDDQGEGSGESADS